MYIGHLYSARGCYVRFALTCYGFFQVAPEVASFESKQRAELTPEEGVAGLVLTTYMSALNGAAFFAFRSIHSYPSIGGNNQISGEHV